MKLWGNEAFIGKSFVLPKTNLKTLFLTWVFTRNRELGSHMVLQRPPDILTSIGYTTSMRILCFTLVGVIIWKSQRKKYSQKRALLYTPRQNTWKLYQKTFPPFWMQDDATSSEVGTLGEPDGNWQPRSSGSALTPCYNEMLFSFECLYYLSWPFQAVCFSFVAVLF